MTISVIIADDHTIVREGLKNLLESKGITVIDIAKNGREAIALTESHRPDIVLMDISMPDLNGVDATAAIRRKVPGTKIIALSMHSDKKVLDNMLGAGASGYILKDAAFDEICTAIQTVQSGRFYLTSSIARMYESHAEYRFSETGRLPKTQGISIKERQVLQLVAEGDKTRDIAKKMGISEKTVESHRRNLMRKLQIFNIAGLTKFAIKEGISAME